MGMSNSSLSFQALMCKVLKNMNFKVALVYIDDVLIFSKNFHEHMLHLQQLFDHLRSANLKLHPSKCAFATKSIKYLGHIISKDGVRVNPQNIEKLRNFKWPTSAKQVKSFLGMANFYRKFIEGYAKIASPLNKLLKKDQRFKWTPECQTAFETLKTKLTEAPILAYPRFELPFILTIDASDYSVGYILSQIQEGREHAIAYNGRALHGSELKWHITEKEALALVEGIQHFREYLTNHKFTVFTDNVSVKYLQNIKDCQGRLGRWSLLLQGYNFEIVHKPGKQNPADFLSRQIYENETSETPDLGQVFQVNANSDDLKTKITFIYENETEEEIIGSLQNEKAKDIQLPNLVQLQRSCPEIADIYQYKLMNTVPDDPEKAKAVVAESYNFELD